MPNIKLTKKEEKESVEEEVKPLSPNIEKESEKEETLDTVSKEEIIDEKSEEPKVESELDKTNDTEKEEVETGVEKVDFDKDESETGENIKIKTLVDGLDFKSKNVKELLDKIVLNALESKSSDVHIEPREGDIVVRYRIDGLLREVLVVDKSNEESLLFRIKIAARLRTDEHFAPQDGRIRFDFADRRLDTRVSILPITKGEKVVMRLLSQDGRSFKLEDLGIVGEQLKIIQKNYAKPYGMILSTGPTGSGKTTTLYSILKIINSADKNITTIEDPVEYDIAGVNHIQINPKANLTFASGLRSILRQDPDIVMVGEIRDSETAKIAINAAMTGHLVLSTLHTNDAVTTIPRLVHMGVEKYLVASTVNVIVAQRLARKLCEDCKSEYKMDQKILDEIKLTRPDIAGYFKLGEKLYKEVGCTKCVSTGYKGRIGLYEVLELKEDLRKIIYEGGTADELLTAARKDGLTLIVEDGMQKIRDGVVSLSELLRVTAISE